MDPDKEKQKVKDVGSAYYTENIWKFYVCVFMFILLSIRQINC